jgi:CRP/FNR family transcriptional regulator, cyclic AMP receptor protein
LTVAQRTAVGIPLSWPILEGVPGEVVDRLLGAGLRHRYRANEVVFHEGDPADTLHLVLKGKASVSITSPYGNEVIFRMIKEGEIFGELSLLTPDGLRTATVRAVEPFETLAIRHRDFDHFRVANPEVAWLLAKMLAEQLRRTNGRLVEALFVPVEVRVLRRLVELTETYGKGEEAVIPLSQEELANLAGSTRATTNRVLKKEEKRGTLRLDRGRITIVDRGSLARRAAR